MNREDYKLCYVKGHKAWFTDNLEKCWGDDWDDRPYEYNAEPPSESYSNLEVLYFDTNDWSEIQPCTNYSNSPYSVEDINKGAIAWIKTDNYSIGAGTKLKDFIEIIQYYDGTIWEKYRF